MVEEDTLGGCIALADDAFVTAFENATIADDAFRHADHVRLAWIYLRRLSFLEATRTYRRGLRRFATAHGAPTKYHETVTRAFLILINERLHGADEGRELDWPEFAHQNPDLLKFRDGALFEYYGPEVLESKVAREIFVLPKPVMRP